MLAEFFVHDGGDTQTWRLKGHARKVFWRWVASWGALVRKPSDLGYEDAGYDLPPLSIEHHIIPADHGDAVAAGKLFFDEARDLTERRSARKATVSKRVEMCAAMVNASPNEPWVVWGDLNAETEALTKAIDGAVEVRGSDDFDVKEERLSAFARGEIRVLVSKASICGWGSNWQHCARMAFVGVNDSWESYHQAIRRIWRFRQTRPVEVHLFASELERAVVANLRRKEDDAARMSEELSEETRDAVRDEVLGARSSTSEYNASASIRIPAWLQSRKAG